MAGVRRRGDQGGQRQLVLHPQLFVLRPGTDELTEAVTGAYAFSATLAIQDITGLATSGVSASHVRTRLVPSAESAAHLFALTEALSLIHI